MDITPEERQMERNKGGHPCQSIRRPVLEQVLMTSLRNCQF